MQPFSSLLQKRKAGNVKEHLSPKKKKPNDINVIVKKLNPYTLGAGVGSNRLGLQSIGILDCNPGFYWEPQSQSIANSDLQSQSIANENLQSQSIQKNSQSIAENNLQSQSIAEKNLQSQSIAKSALQSQSIAKILQSGKRLQIISQSYPIR